MKNHIAKIRKELGITQEQLAEKTGVSRQTIISLEQNRYNPSLGLAWSVTKTLKKRVIEEVFELT
jgi:putative transcriptional regulator